jgi:hypothetical protein
MAESFAAPAVNSLVSITPLTTPPAGREQAQIPPQLANVAAGTTLEGFVVNRDAGNNPILRTGLGDVLVKSDVFLKTGSNVVFRVDPSQPGAARILTIDGTPLQEYAASQPARVRGGDTISTSPLPMATSSAAAAAVAGTRPAATAQLTAVLLSNLPAASAAAPGASPLAALATTIPAALLKLQQGTHFKATLLDVRLPTAMPVPTAATLPSASATAIAVPQAATPSAPAMPNAAPHALPIAAAPAAPVAPGPVSMTSAPAGAPPAPAAATQPLTAPAPAAIAAPAVSPVPSPAPARPAVQVAPPEPRATQAARAAYGMPRPSELPAPAATTPPVVPPSAQPLAATPTIFTATAPMPAMANSIPAQVIGQEKDGSLILQTPIGSVKLQAPPPIPVGSTVQLALDIVTNLGAPLPSPALGLGGELEQITALAQHWPALDETVQALQTDPATTRQLFQAMPEIGPKLTSGLLFFIAAAKGGDVRQWLGGRTSDLLEAKLPELAARLRADMGQMQQMLADSPLHQWNSAMVPLLYQGALEHARLFFRHEQSTDDEASRATRSSKDQRFIVEVDLSHLGEMQFDGFVRQGKSARQFDLIVRSTATLPPELEQQIRTTFETAMQTTGMSGYLGFQHGNQHFVRPLADNTPSHGTVPQPILA